MFQAHQLILLSRTSTTLTQQESESHLESLTQVDLCLLTTKLLLMTVLEAASLPLQVDWSAHIYKHLASSQLTIMKAINSIYKEDSFTESNTEPETSTVGQASVRLLTYRQLESQTHHNQSPLLQAIALQSQSKLGSVSKTEDHKSFTTLCTEMMALSSQTSN